jgi:protein phosphatase
MEDSHLALINAGTASDGNPVSLFAVLDGHCGRRVADLGTHFLPEALLSRPTLGTDNATAFVEAVIQTDRAIFQQMGRTDGGSTLIAALVHNRMLFVANLGDARAVLYDGSTIAMSTDHKPTDTLEQQRIVRCGSFVHFGRVGACLAVSRALGDFEFKFNGNRYGTEKEFAVGNVPDICQINITDSTQFLILACDGLWDVCSNEESTAFVNSFVASADTKDFNRTLNLCATQLAIHAVERGSMDNVTVLIVWFHDPPVTLAPTTSPTAQPSSVVNGNPSAYGGYSVGSSNPNPSTPKAGLGRPPSQGTRANSVGAGFSRTAPMGVANRLPSLATPKRGNL